MGLSPGLRAFDRRLAEQNREALEASPPAPLPTPTVAPTPVAIPTVDESWQTRGKVGCWRVRYRSAADSPYYTSTWRAETPQELVRFMRDTFRGNEYLIVERVWEAETA